MNNKYLSDCARGTFDNKGNRTPAECIECKSGLRLSVQAGDFLYCSPRINDADFYTHVEVGFPSEKIEELMPYCEDHDDPTGTVYGYVPIELVATIISRHGGEKL